MILGTYFYYCLKLFNNSNPSVIVIMPPYHHHWVKSVRIRSFTCPYFPAFGLNTERFGVSLCIQCECGKIRTRKTPNTGTFHAVHALETLLIVGSLNLLLDFTTSWWINYAQ